MGQRGQQTGSQAILGLTAKLRGGCIQLCFVNGDYYALG